MPMDKEVLQVFASVAGIGGVSIGFAMLTFREIIRKKIFPNFSKAQAYKILRLIIILTWTIALAGIVAFVVVSIPKTKLRSDVRIVDVAFQEEGGHTRLDLKLRNVGEEPAFLKKAQLDILGVWQLVPTVQFCLQPSSATYAVNLPKGLDQDDHHELVEVNISQLVEPRNADRFEFSMFYEGEQDARAPTFIYQAKLNLIYDEDNKVVVTDDFLFAVQTTSYDSCWSEESYTYPEKAHYSGREDMRFSRLEIMERNKNVITIIAAIKANRSPIVQALTDRIQSIDLSMDVKELQEKRAKGQAQAIEAFLERLKKSDT